MAKLVSISDYFWFQEGPGVRNTQYTDSGVKLLNVANLVDGRVDLSTSHRYISEEEAYGKYKHFLVDEGDFIIASSGIKVEYFEKKMGFISKEQLPLCMNTSTIRFKNMRPEEVRIRFLMYYMKSRQFKEQLARNITGSAQLNFGPSHLKKMVFPLYSLEKQDHLIGLLDKIDTIITSGQTQLAKLDQLVKSQFIEMFGDPILNDKGWPISKINELGENLDSRRIPITSGNRVQGIYPYYGASGIVDYVEDYIFDEDILLISEDGANLLARVTPIAFPSSGKVWVNNHTHVMRFSNKCTQCYVEHLLNMIDISDYVTGTAQPKLNQAKLNSIPIPTPPLGTMQRFEDIVNQADKSKFEIQQSIDKLKMLRKSLMQEYFG